jgi:hypothetical protein
MIVEQVIQPSILRYQEGWVIVYLFLGSEPESSLLLFLLAVLCAMPQKHWAAKHKPLMFLPERLPLCRFSSSSLELDEE